MNEERAKAAFNVRELTYLLDGGEKATAVSLSGNGTIPQTVELTQECIDPRAHDARDRARSSFQNGRHL